MRVLMGIIKNEHGVYLARKKVPPALEEAVARVTSAPRPRVSWLQRSLRTKDLREANIKAKPVLMEFDRILAKAAASSGPRPMKSDLSDAEIKRIAGYHYASILEEDEELRSEGGSEDVFQAVLEQLKSSGVEATTFFPPHPKPRYGLSDREMTKIEETLTSTLPAAQKALGRHDITYIEEDLKELLDEFGIVLSPKSDAFRKLGVAVLRQHVAALKALTQRHQGEPVETPKVAPPVAAAAPQGETLRAALEGWKKVKVRSSGTTREFDHAVARFIELHGDIAISAITRRHVREFREALQSIPRHRSGALQGATLPVLVEWSAKHPEAPRIGPATINKLLGGVQAVSGWGRDNGLIPDDVAWLDPFSNMRLEEKQSDREPWELAELRLLFGSRIYTAGDRPRASGGEAAVWLPLLGLFTGARLGELAPLTVRDIRTDEQTGITFIEITEDEAAGKRVKTASSRRVVPVHPELRRLGFLDYVEGCRGSGGRDAALFPVLQQRGGGSPQWSKWFGRYIRRLGVERAVFHSFRHGFKDALRAAGESNDINDALTGHSGAGVGQQYGAKDMMRRFTLPRLADAVAKVAYPGLDLTGFARRGE